MDLKEYLWNLIAFSTALVPVITASFAIYDFFECDKVNLSEMLMLEAHRFIDFNFA